MRLQFIPSMVRQCCTERSIFLDWDRLDAAICNSFCIVRILWYGTYMDPSDQYGTVAQKPKWQLRWGHILLALFFIVLIIIAYVVVHQINSADKTPLATGTTNSHVTRNNKKNNSNKPSAAPNSNPAKSAGGSNDQSKGSNFPSPNPSTSSPASSSASSNNASNLANTGPGNTISLFIGASLLGALVHHLFVRRRLGLTNN